LNNENIKLLFGLKIKQLRIEQKLGQQELANIAGLSVSYINEIEKGKKYPKSDKIMALAKVFKIDYDDLVSLKLSKNLAPIANLLNSNFLKYFPLDVFGINPSELIDLMSDTPSKLGAFVNTIIEIGRSYNLTVEDFYFAVLRSYQEMHNNYFEEIEKVIEHFLIENQISSTKLINEELLVNFLKSKYSIDVQYYDEKSQPQLASLRSIMMPSKKTLLINNGISADQRTFTLGREVGFLEMNLKIRPMTSSWVSFESFEQIFNNFKASYFSSGIIIQKEILKEKISELFAKKTFKSEDLVDLALYFKATPETFFHQMAKVLINDFGVEDLFFLRFDNNLHQETYYLTKEMHLSQQYAPNGIVDEHYCRRWKAISILQELKEVENKDLYEKPIGGIQISNFHNTESEYLMFSMARPLNIVKEVNSSVSIGMKLNRALKSKINFIQDESIPYRIVNRTCERCAIFDCKERVASPKILQKRRKNEELEKIIKELCV
jgi:XRE family transcriptional regulator, fatty acid utilization regulator